MNSGDKAAAQAVALYTTTTGDAYSFPGNMSPLYRSIDKNTDRILRSTKNATSARNKETTTLNQGNDAAPKETTCDATELNAPAPPEPPTTNDPIKSYNTYPPAP